MNEDILYNEKEAIGFIRNYLPQEMKEKFSDADLEDIIDSICEYYESTGLMDGEDDKVVDIDEDELTAYVVRRAGDRFGTEETAFVVQGELAYCDSINLFE